MSFSSLSLLPPALYLSFFLLLFLILPSPFLLQSVSTLCLPSIPLLSHTQSRHCPHLSESDIIKPLNELKGSALSGATWPHQCHCLACLHIQIQSLQYLKWVCTVSTHWLVHMQQHVSSVQIINLRGRRDDKQDSSTVMVDEQPRKWSQLIHLTVGGPHMSLCCFAILIYCINEYYNGTQSIATFWLRCFY